MLVVQTLADHDDAINPTAAHHVLNPFTRIASGLRQQHVITASGELVRDAAQHFEEEGVGKTLLARVLQWDDDRDGAGHACSQRARRRVDAVVDPSSDVAHALARFFGDFRATGERARDRRQ